MIPFIPIPLFDNLSCKGRSYVTLTLLWVNIAVFLLFEWPLSNDQLQDFLMKWGLVPDKFTQALASGDPHSIAWGFLTLLTASFLHGGYLHLFGNMAFLQAVGRSLEARMGSFNFALFYFVGGAAGWAMFIFSDPTSSIPAVGASGAISALIAAYLVFYPMAKFRGFALITVVPLFTVTWAWNLLFVWVYYQYYSGYLAIANPATAGNVAIFAHVGGICFGLLVAGVWRLVSPDSDICYVPISCGGDTTPGKEKIRWLVPNRFKHLMRKHNCDRNHDDCGCDHKKK
jgi:membrane associated rhomboid family serine protease